MKTTAATSNKHVHSHKNKRGVTNLYTKMASVICGSKHIYINKGVPNKCSTREGWVGFLLAFLSKIGYKNVHPPSTKAFISKRTDYHYVINQVLEVEPNGRNEPKWMLSECRHDRLDRSRFEGSASTP